MDLSKITKKCPDRSPLIIASALKDIIRNKVICDIGCREGDMIIAFSDYAIAYGVECSEENINILKYKGLSFIEGDFFKMEIPTADIYYIWIRRYVNLEALDRIKKGIVILGGDPSINEVYDEFLNDRGIKYEKLSVPYDEGNGVRQKGEFELTIVKKEI